MKNKKNFPITLVIYQTIQKVLILFMFIGVSLMGQPAQPSTDFRFDQPWKWKDLSEYARNQKTKMRIQKLKGNFVPK